MRDLALTIGYFPIATAAIGLHAYVRYFYIKKYDFYVYAFSSLFLSIFSISVIFYIFIAKSLISIVMSQISSVSLMFILVRLAVSRAADGSTRMLVDRGLPAKALILMALMPASVVIVIDWLVENISPRCIGAKCGALEFVFGSDDVFTLYYFTNLYGVVFLTLSALSINALTRRFLAKLK
ncbi:hypothetical protein ELI55_01195 [Rhizobium ruizarguesonis]|uniref:hypothetical protein n=1 Tax=Rhizobium ruizarguesonis TaxID=2081791 RepID=UPI00103096B3|nr:hypothetical protein [Rhizobium ruizarguesonis]TAU03621.1 hypothetical protein ELI55_01195 [Rhizobium ruizarguesonis]